MIVFCDKITSSIAEGKLVDVTNSTSARLWVWSPTVSFYQSSGVTVWMDR